MDAITPPSRIVIEGSYQSGRAFTVDPKWWSEAARNINTLKARLEKPMLTDWDEATQRHKVEARKITWLRVREKRRTSGHLRVLSEIGKQIATT